MGTGILEANKAVVMGLVEAINEHRLDRLPAVLASDVGAHNMIIYGEPDRPGAAFEALRQTLTAFPDLHVRVDDLIAEGDGVVARITQSGTNTGVHAPGRRFENEAIWIFTVVGGKVTEIRAVADRMTMLTRLGVLPEPGRPRRIPNVRTSARPSRRLSAWAVSRGRRRQWWVSRRDPVGGSASAGSGRRRPGTRSRAG